MGNSSYLSMPLKLVLVVKIPDPEAKPAVIAITRFAIAWERFSGVVDSETIALVIVMLPA